MAVYWSGGAPGILSANAYVEILSSSANPPQRPPAGTAIRIRNAETLAEITSGLFDESGNATTGIRTLAAGYVSFGVTDVRIVDISADDWTTITRLVLTSAVSQLITDEAARDAAFDALSARIAALEPLALNVTNVAAFPGTPSAGSGFFVGADFMSTKNVTIPAIRFAVMLGPNQYIPSPAQSTDVALTAGVATRITHTVVVSNGGTVVITPQYQLPGSDLWYDGTATTATVTGTAEPITLTLTPQNAGILASWTHTTPSGKVLSNFTVGRDGTDNTGYGAFSTTDPVGTTSRLFDKLVDSQTYNITVQANYSDGSTFSAQKSASPLAPAATPPTISASATAGNGQATISWAVVNQGSSAVTGFTVGRTGASNVAKLATDTSHTFTGLTNGQSYALFAEGTNATGTGNRVTINVTPTTTPSNARRVPLVTQRVNGSRLPFNNVIFQGGTPSQSSANSFVSSRGGRPIDGFLTFPARGSWNDFRTGYGDAKALMDSGGILIWSIPHAPTSEGDNMNSRGANNAYASEQQALGAWWAANGFNTNRFIVRIDWEYNGNWYNWSANRGGGASALKESIKNFVNNVRAGGGTQIRFNLCANKGPSQSGAHFPQVFPGAEWIDVVGVDQYDQWGPAFNDGQWATEIGSSKYPTVQYVADFARANGILWSWDEGGNTHPADGNHGGDNPFYWQKKWDFLVANADVCAWDNTYLHPGAPDSLKHDFASNPNSFNTYKASTRWGQ